MNKDVGIKDVRILLGAASAYAAITHQSGAIDQKLNPGRSASTSMRESAQKEREDAASRLKHAALLDAAARFVDLNLPAMNGYRRREHASAEASCIAATPAALDLYRVTLNWETPDSDAGDYSTFVWAADPDEAIRRCAEEMAIIDGHIIESSSERESFIQGCIDNAGPYAAEHIPSFLSGVLAGLLYGPSKASNPSAQRDMEMLAHILAPYGVEFEETASAARDASAVKGACHD